MGDIIDINTKIINYKDRLDDIERKINDEMRMIKKDESSFDDQMIKKFSSFGVISITQIFLFSNLLNDNVQLFLISGSFSSFSQTSLKKLFVNSISALLKLSCIAAQSL